VPGGFTPFSLINELILHLQGTSMRRWATGARRIVDTSHTRSTPYSVLAFDESPPRRLSRRLNGGEQERDQHRNNGDHYQQFDQRKTSTMMHLNVLPEKTSVRTAM
jgi:hypothetical protein